MPTPPPPQRPGVPGGNLGTTYVPPVVAPTAAGGGTTLSEPGRQLNIPGNILPWIEDASASTGVPVPVLAATVYRETGWAKLDEDYGPALVLLAARDIAQQHQALADSDSSFGTDVSGGLNGWINAAAGSGSRSGGNATAYRNSILSALGLDANTVKSVGRVGFTEDSLWTQGTDKALPDTSKSRTIANLFGRIGGNSIDLRTPAVTSLTNINDAYRLFKGLTGRDPKSDAEVRPYIGMTNTQTENAISALPEAVDWRKYGSKVGDAKRWAESIYVNLVDRLPTTDELKEIVDRGYGPNTLEAYLRRQPYGTGTIGQLADARKVADQVAQKELGRPPDEGELNFLVQNGITTSDSISSFYEQLRQRKETGDPSFAWVGNPKQWRDMQATVDQIWKHSGLTSAVDPHIVNDAITAKWTADDIQNYVDNQPAPGFQTGVTVGQVNRIKPIADNWKATWYPTEKASQEELRHFITGGFDSEQIHNYYGNMPSTTAPAPTLAKVDMVDPTHPARVSAQANVPANVGGTP